MSGSPKQYSQAVAEPGKSPLHKLLGFAVILGALLSFAASATLEPEEMFRVEQLASREGRHIVVLGDFSIPHTTDGRAHIIDADRGDYLGVVNTGFWHGGVLLPRSKNLIVSPETYFSRGTRGKRTDIVAFYDAQTLQPLAETEIPPKRFTPVKMQASSALSDDDRFAFVLNHTPAASVSVVDVQNRVFTAEIDIPGCFNLYATGRRSFNAICANGGFLQVEVDDNGKPASLTRTEVLFNGEEELWVSFTCQRRQAYTEEQVAGLIQMIAERRVGNRPGRVEPRAVKRRPKPLPLLTEPREIARARVERVDLSMMTLLYDGGASYRKHQ